MLQEYTHTGLPSRSLEKKLSIGNVPAVQLYNCGNYIAAKNGLGAAGLVCSYQETA